MLTTDFTEVLRSPDIDAVAIVTPVWTHFELAKAALENGKHVFVEKPFTSTSAQAEELIELAERKNLQIMVDHTFLFSGAVRKIRELVDNGTLGPLYYFDSTRVNLGLFQHDVSVVWDLAPHDLSIMDYIIGEQPEAVVATGGKHLNGLADMAFITVYFPGNIIAHINVNWLSPVKVRTTLIGGKDKMLVWNDLEPDEKIKVYDKGVHDHQRPGRLRPAGQLSLRRRVGTEGRADRGAEGRARLLRRLHLERPDAARTTAPPVCAIVRLLEAAGAVAAGARQRRSISNKATEDVDEHNDNIPFLDLVTPHRELEDELVAVFRKAHPDRRRSSAARWSKGSSGISPTTATTRHCVGVANGTDALRFALMAAGVQARRHRGDGAEHLHRHDRGDLAGRGAAGLRRHRRAHLHAGSREAAGVPRDRSASRDAQTGPPDQQAHRQPGHGDRPGAPVRADGRHGSDPRAGRRSTA